MIGCRGGAEEHRLCTEPITSNLIVKCQNWNSKVWTVARVRLGLTSDSGENQLVTLRIEHRYIEPENQFRYWCLEVRKSMLVSHTGWINTSTINVWIYLKINVWISPFCIYGFGATSGSSFVQKAAFSARILYLKVWITKALCVGEYASTPPTYDSHPLSKHRIRHTLGWWATHCTA